MGVLVSLGQLHRPQIADVSDNFETAHKNEACTRPAHNRDAVLSTPYLTPEARLGGYWHDSAACSQREALGEAEAAQTYAN